MPPAVLQGLRNYLGSIATDATGRVVAATSPVGGSVALWDTNDGKFLDSTDHPDGCGVAALDDGRFLVSDGFGGIHAFGADGRDQVVRETSAGMAWDNHMRRA
jgi:hypothetical protein